MYELTNYNAAIKSLAMCVKVDEVKDIHDQSEAMLKYAQISKNMELELYASQLKLRAQRRLGEIISGMETSQGLRPTDGSKSKKDSIAAAGISKTTSQRYEQLAAIPEEIIESYISESTADNKPMVLAGAVAYHDPSKPHVTCNSGNNEWYTPADIIEIARRIMGSIDTDPASSDIANKTVKAGTFYTEEQDGLQQEWSGNVWMNPPYAQPLTGHFCNAVVTKFEHREIISACVLVNNATETAWFQRLLEQAAAVCFIKGRIKYFDPTGRQNGSPLQGQCLLYFGDNTEKFSRECLDLGKVLSA